MKQILETRIVPVTVIERADDAVPLARALQAGGIPVIEVTLRTPAALDAVRRIAAEAPDVLIGAGTILTPDQVTQAVAAGARFGVAPGLNEAVVRRAAELGMPFVPGVMTPSEIERALELGCRLLKFFPAENAGGAKMLKALAGPYAHTGVKFLPLGGVGPANAAEYLALPVVGAVGGSWLAEKAILTARNWPEVTARAEEAGRLVRRTPVKG